MAFSLNQFTGNLKGGGARSSLFEVRFDTKPGGVKDIVPFMVKTAELPASTVGAAEVAYFGRRVKIAGDRTFGDWTVTIINDEDFAIRKSIESWMNSINGHVSNLNTVGTAPNDYKIDANIVQFSKTGEELETYKFAGMFPTELSTIALSWDAGPEPQEYTVTFSIDWWEHAGSTDSTGQ